MASFKTRKRLRRDFVHPSGWFRQAIADELWMPLATADVPKISRPVQQRVRRARPKRSKKRKRKKKRGVYPKRPRRYEHDRVPEHFRVVEPLLTSWFDVSSYTEEARPSGWMALANPAPARATGSADATDTNTSDEEEHGNPINAVTKLRLFPTPMQKAKLDQMFATNRAIYNKMVALSRMNQDDNTTELMLKLRPIAVVESMSKFFRNNRRALARHRMVNDDVRDSAFQDFKKAVKSSRALFFNTKARGEKTTYPKFKFKSKFDPSNTIEIRSRSIRAIDVEGERRVRFHPTFFGLARDEGIAIHERLPELTASVRLQRLREGEVYLIVPRVREFPQTFSKRVCAIDPGVRNFVTMYDPNGRTLSVTDSHRFLRKRFEAIDKVKSTLAQLENVAKERVERKDNSEPKSGTEPRKSSDHRLRYRLRRQIRYGSRKVTRCVADMHHKVSSWLATHYRGVLLPSFQTSEMVARYTQEVAIDATPDVAPTNVQKRKIRSPTARAMLAQAHYRFKMLLKYKMERAGGRLCVCEEEYTSKTCSGCGTVKDNLGGSAVYHCARCLAVFDRDVNAAKNIFHKNMLLLM